MSGLLAVFARDGRNVDSQIIDRALRACPEHAVDGVDLWIGKCTALAHQHFCVSDHDVGVTFPTSDPSGRYWITVDSRLDNREELLERLGLKSTPSISDGEVILAAFVAWNTHCVTQLLGDFAFAIWDRNRQELFLARDALGARGLCYYLDSTILVVATSLPMVLATLHYKPRINETKLAEQLCDLWISPEQTLFENVLNCPPAHCMVVSSTSNRMWQYWGVDSDQRIFYHNEYDYAVHFKDLIAQCVRSRLQTTERIGISLSGGLDSATVAAIASISLQNRDRKLVSFTNVFDELQDCDERDYVSEAVSRFPIEANYIRSDDHWTLRDIHRWPIFPEMVHTSPYYLMWESIAGAVHESHCRVLLTGGFGDQLYTGAIYWAYEAIRSMDIMTLLKPLGDGPPGPVVREYIWKRGLRLALVPNWLRSSFALLSRSIRQKCRLGLDPSFLRRADLEGRLQEYQRRQVGSNLASSLRRRAILSTQDSEVLPASRRLENSFGYDVALPFYDRRLIEYVLSVPSKILGLPYRSRAVQRRAMKGLVPDTILRRYDKATFVPLMERGLLERERYQALSFLRYAVIVDQGIVTREYRNQLLEQLQRGTANVSAVWQFVCLERWMRAYS